MKNQKEPTISVTFSTLAGRKNLLWTLKEALESELAAQVRHLLKLSEEGAVGIQIQHPFYGKINLDLAGRE